MSHEPTASEHTIWNLKEKATILEVERKKAYVNRLSEIVAETSTWDIPKEVMPMKIAERAFRLGCDFADDRMYNYI